MPKENEMTESLNNGQSVLDTEINSQKEKKNKRQVLEEENITQNQEIQRLQEELKHGGNDVKLTQEENQWREQNRYMTQSEYRRSLEGTGRMKTVNELKEKEKQERRRLFQRSKRQENEIEILIEEIKRQEQHRRILQEEYERQQQDIAKIKRERELQDNEMQRLQKIYEREDKKRQMIEENCRKLEQVKRKILKKCEKKEHELHELFQIGRLSKEGSNAPIEEILDILEEEWTETGTRFNFLKSASGATACGQGRVTKSATLGGRGGKM